MKSRFTAVSTLQKRVWRLGWDYKTHQDLQIATFRYKSLCNSLQIAIGFFLDFVLSFLVGVVLFSSAVPEEKTLPRNPQCGCTCLQRPHAESQLLEEAGKWPVKSCEGLARQR